MKMLKTTTDGKERLKQLEKRENRFLTQVQEMQAPSTHAVPVGVSKRQKRS